MMSHKEGEGGWSFCNKTTKGLGHKSVTEGEGGG